MFSLAGCSESNRQTDPKPTPDSALQHVTHDYEAGTSDGARARAATLRVLFIGNSHTSSEALPELVCRLIEFARPAERVYGHVIHVAFLSDIVSHPTAFEEVDSGRWNVVVLQAQKISTSGKYDYSRDVGIDLAKRAAARGATVYFFAEWGMRGDPESGRRHQRIYQEMADASGAQVIPVGLAWDLALAKRPDLELHAGDGNHESKLGAFLTACVIAGRLAGVDAARFAEFPANVGDAETRARLSAAAARSLAPMKDAEPADDLRREGAP